MVVRGIRQILADIRQDIIGEIFKGDAVNETDILGALSLWLEQTSRPYLRRVVNATGIILHTNLGRAPLAAAAIDAIAQTASGYSNLEYDLTNGERGSRYRHVEQLLIELTGAESALVVNNNAAAVLLILSALAAQKEVVISRGQLVEIGGSFRVPDVMKQSGAILVEVGATNRTHLNDFSRAINEQTGLLLRVHTSNFRMTGFVAEVPAKELVELGQKYGVPVYEDQGSGMLVRLPGTPHYDPTVKESIAAGIDVVSFSGDKMLGGPQAGIVVGKKVFINQMKQHPLLRAFRIDKLSLAALETTLRLYRQGEAGMKKIPFAQMFTASQEALTERAQHLARELSALNSGGTVSVLEVAGQAGGGSLPGEEIPSVAVGLAIPNMILQEGASLLRQADIPVVCRIADDKLLFDVRTIADEEITLIVNACRKLIK
jgi:L-seryl-tRNA(Ser) seleniumtransferase